MRTTLKKGTRRPANGNGAFPPGPLPPLEPASGTQEPPPPPPEAQTERSFYRVRRNPLKLLAKGIIWLVVILLMGAGALAGGVKLYFDYSVSEIRATDPAVIAAADELAEISGADKTLRVWDATTGRLIREIANSNIVGRVALSPDGQLVASVGMTQVKSGAVSTYPLDNCIRIWDVQTGKEVRQLHMDGKVAGDNYPLSFNRLMFAPDGKTLLTVGGDGLLRFWDPVTGKEHGKSRSAALRS